MNRNIAAATCALGVSGFAAQSSWNGWKRVDFRSHLQAKNLYSCRWLNISRCVRWFDKKIQTFYLSKYAVAEISHHSIDIYFHRFRAIHETNACLEFRYAEGMKMCLMPLHLQYCMRLVCVGVLTKFQLSCIFHNGIACFNYRSFF